MTELVLTAPIPITLSIPVQAPKPERPTERPRLWAVSSGRTEPVVVVGTLGEAVRQAEALSITWGGVRPKIKPGRLAA